MPLRFLIIFILGIASATAQQKAYRFIDAETKRPVADADVYADSVLIGPTDFNGNFRLKANLKPKNLIIDHLAYEKRTIPYDSLLIKRVYQLKRHSNVIKEVVVDEEMDTLTAPLTNPGWGSKTATFIAYKNDDYIKALRFRVVNIGGVKGLNFLPFKANVYTVDSITKLPGKPLIPKDVLVENPKGDTWAVADISSYEIKVPKAGLYIVFIIPGFEEGLYKTDFIESKYGLISAVPALQLAGVKKDRYSYAFNSYFDGVEWSQKEWRLVKHSYYRMEFEYSDSGN